MADIKLYGTLHNVTGEPVARANEIYDETQEKNQSTINANVEETIGADDVPGSIKGRIKENETALEEGGSVDQRIAEEGAKHYLKSETYTKSELNSMITTPNQGYVTVTATDQTTDVTDVLPATGSADTVYRVGNWDGSQFDETVYSEYAWDGSQYVHLSTKTQIGEVFDISAYHATGDTLAIYDNLAAALDSNNGGGVPQSLQKGGMSIKFVQSSDNKYVQARCMAQNFTTDVTQWQGIDDIPNIGSNNLVKSGGVIENLKKLGLYETVTADVTTWQEGKYVVLTGARGNSSSYNITNRTAVKVGDVIVVTANALSNVSLVAKYGGRESNNFTNLLTGTGTLCTQQLIILEDCEIVFSYNINYNITVDIIRDTQISKKVEKNADTTLVLEKKTSDKNLSEISFESTTGKYVNNLGRVVSSAYFSYSKPVFITKGTTVIINASGYNSNVCMLAKVVTEDSLYTPLVISESDKSNYIYYIKESAYYAFSYSNAKEHVHYRLIECGLLFENNIYDYLSLFKNCICIGDSLTRGYQSSYSDGQRNRDGGYPTRLSRMTRLNVYNYGKSGATPTSMYEHLTEITRDYSIFDIALICLGRNGSLTSSEDQNNYANIITLLKTANPHITIFCLSLPPSKSGEVTDKSINDRIKTIATNNSCYYIDIYHDTIIQDAAYRDDGVHYKTLGYMLMAEVIKCRVNEYIGTNHAAFMDLWVDNQYNNIIDGLVE